MRFKMPREFYIPKGSTKIADKQSDAVAYVYESAGAPYAATFFGKQAKPVAHHRYRNIERRSAHIAELFESRRKSLEFRSGLRAERKAFEHDYKVGQIFSTCWGYDQTNREYFEVVEVRGAHLILREIAQHRTETGFMQGKCAPKPGEYIGEPIRRLAQKGGVKISSCRWGSPEKPTMVAGVPVYDSDHWTAYA